MGDHDRRLVKLGKGATDVVDVIGEMPGSQLSPAFALAVPAHADRNGRAPAPCEVGHEDLAPHPGAAERAMKEQDRCSRPRTLGRGLDGLQGGRAVPARDRALMKPVF